MDIETFRKAGHAAVDRIARYYESLEHRPVSSTVEPGAIANLVPRKPPTTSEDFEHIMLDFDRVILPGITHWQHPSFFAYFPSNSTFESIIADMFAGAVSNPGFNWSCAPAATELEVVMMDWVADLLGLGDMWKSTSEKGGGIIMGSASEAVLTVAVAARERALHHSFATYVASLPRPKTTYPTFSEDGRPMSFTPDPIPPPTFETMPAAQRAEWTGRLVMYGSTQTHSLGKKAAMILGLEWKGLTVKEEDSWALRGATLARALEEDTKNGYVPCMLIATIGTTNSGAVDYLDELIAVAKQYPSLWVHVDAAWAGVYLSLPECRSELFLETLNAVPHPASEPSSPTDVVADRPATPSSLPPSSQQTSPVPAPIPAGVQVMSPKPFHKRTGSGVIPRRPSSIFKLPPPPPSPEEVLRTPPGFVHSFNTNLHKAGLVTFDCSTLWVKERKLLTDALDLTPAYLKTKHGDEGAVIDYRNWQLPLGRRFRSIKIYFTLRSFGTDGFRAHLRRHIQLAEHFEALVHDSKDFEIVAARSLGLVIFRYNPFKDSAAHPADEMELNAVNKELNTVLQTKPEIAITGTVLGQRHCIRWAVGGRRTKVDHVDKSWEIIKEAAKEAQLETGVGIVEPQTAGN